MAQIDNYYYEQIIEIIIFDLELIEKMLNLVESEENCRKIQLDLEAIKFDLGIIKDMLVPNKERI
jgi:hypothetical protein